MKDVEKEEQLRQKLNTLLKSENDGFLAYKLLSYILATNRNTIIKLKKEEKVELPSSIMEQFE